VRKHLQAVSLAIWKAAPHLIDQSDAERIADAAIRAVDAVRAPEIIAALDRYGDAAAKLTHVFMRESRDVYKAELITFEQVRADLLALFGITEDQS
jgi:hypothetical protein